MNQRTTWQRMLQLLNDEAELARAKTVLGVETLESRLLLSRAAHYDDHADRQVRQQPARSDRDTEFRSEAFTRQSSQPTMRSVEEQCVRNDSQQTRSEQPRSEPQSSTPQTPQPPLSSGSSAPAAQPPQTSNPPRTNSSPPASTNGASSSSNPTSNAGGGSTAFASLSAGSERSPGTSPTSGAAPALRVVSFVTFQAEPRAPVIAAPVWLDVVSETVTEVDDAAVAERTSAGESASRTESLPDPAVREQTADAPTTANTMGSEQDLGGLIELDAAWERSLPRAVDGEIAIPGVAPALENLPPNWVELLVDPAAEDLALRSGPWSPEAEGFIELMPGETAQLQQLTAAQDVMLAMVGPQELNASLGLFQAFELAGGDESVASQADLAALPLISEPLTIAETAPSESGYERQFLAAALTAAVGVVMYLVRPEREVLQKDKPRN